MGLEPTTPGTTIRCSYQLSYTHHSWSLALARQEGLEPPAYCLEGSCSILLSYWRLFRRQLAPAPGDSARTRPQALLYYHYRGSLSSMSQRVFVLYEQFLRGSTGLPRSLVYIIIPCSILRPSTRRTLSSMRCSVRRPSVTAASRAVRAASTSGMPSIMSPPASRKRIQTSPLS